MLPLRPARASTRPKEETPFLHVQPDSSLTKPSSISIPNLLLVKRNGTAVLGSQLHLAVMEQENDLDDTLTKKQVRDIVPKRIKEFEFGILSNEEIVKQGVTEITARFLYDLTDVAHGGHRKPTINGPLDRKLGTSNNATTCQTCDLPLKHCNGHFGYIQLKLPVFHVGFLKKIIEILHCICKDCSNVLLDEKTKSSFRKPLRRPNRDNMEHKALIRKIMTECRKCKVCPYCKGINGTIKKVAGHALKIAHERYRAYPDSTKEKKKDQPRSKIRFQKSFADLLEEHPELKPHTKRAADDNVDPIRVLGLFKRIPPSDFELLGMSSEGSKPETLIWEFLPVPPASIRPSVAQEGATTEDDTTNKLGDIIQINSMIQAALDRGQPISTVREQWDYLQIQVAMYINSEIPNLQQAGFGKPIRGFCQRLKGKQGRFRGNLSGKRVDFSGRTVISPDPNLGIDEVAIPQRVAKNLTFPDKVTPRNYAELRQAVCNGSERWPGANFIFTRRGFTKNLRCLDSSGLYRVADRLEMGDVVHRHLIDDDIVLFNRQPSLHKLSILSHRVKVRNWRTFRLNECVCKPYNADFDGDEMNLHVPQTEEARVEATELMNVKHNLATPKDGTPIIAATQDFITAAFLLSSKDRFYSRAAFAQICSYMFNGDAVRDATGGRVQFYNILLPAPAILRPEVLWTGKQVFNVLIRPTSKSKVLANFDATCRQFTKGDDRYNREDDQYMVVRNSEVLSGVMDKNVLGDGKKDSIFYVLMRDFGPDCAVQAMNRLSKLAARWLSNEGFSIGIRDVFPGRELVKNKQILIKEAYDKCDELIRQLKLGKLRRDAGCDEEQTMENQISGILSAVRQEAGKICFEHLSSWNSPIIMAKSGAKGSNINVAQMVATVGQQIINSQRVEDGFQDRTLPHFPKAARQPPSKGFVSSSFFTGLSPTEFIFHAMSGREGLVDTAVKTAETGYMSRRLMKSLEDLSAQYDDTVRNASSGIVQFRFGQDGLDPVDMEGKAKPVNFERTFLHAQVSEWSNRDRCLLPEDVVEKTAAYLQKYKDTCKRVSKAGQKLDYKVERAIGSDGEMESEENFELRQIMITDEFESKRDFIVDVESFIEAKADALRKAREYFGTKEQSIGGAPKRGRKPKAQVDKPESHVRLADGVMKITHKTLDTFLALCMRKYEKAKVEPGHAVGAVGAQSIGEPGTQMTLKTFHFAGVAGMSMTQGVPRIKEIINASKAISTPLINCTLDTKSSEVAARAVKSRIERTYLKDVSLPRF